MNGEQERHIRRQSIQLLVKPSQTGLAEATGMIARNIDQAIETHHIGITGIDSELYEAAFNLRCVGKNCAERRPAVMVAHHQVHRHLKRMQHLLEGLVCFLFPVMRQIAGGDHAIDIAVVATDQGYTLGKTLFRAGPIKRLVAGNEVQVCDLDKAHDTDFFPPGENRHRKVGD